jgi:hypothetical protein
LATDYHEDNWDEYAQKNEREFKNVTFSSISGAKMPKAQDMKLVWLWD